jgi:hypothetical protein
VAEIADVVVRHLKQMPAFMVRREYGGVRMGRCLYEEGGGGFKLDLPSDLECWNPHLADYRKEAFARFQKELKSSACEIGQSVTLP